MKAIQTSYKDYLFRSRLEARWAVFFDTIGIKWEYEYEGFTDGKTYYLPDFYFPQYDLHGEIKPANHENKDIAKWLMFDKPLVILSGMPHCKPSVIYNLEPYTIDVIPFINILKPKYGFYWHCSGIDDFGNFEPFLSGIRNAKQARF